MHEMDVSSAKVLTKLIKTGQLYAVRDGLERRSQKDHLAADEWSALFAAAIDTGFHSMVELFLGAKSWSPHELCGPLNRALWNARHDLAALLLAAGASVAEVDFSDVCQTMNAPLMKHFLRAGVDPSRDNGFARALDRHKAKPLLGFYREMRVKYPALDGQAALALHMAARAKNTRWAALLRWAGADPLFPVPWDLSGSWDDPDNLTTAASAACWRRSEEIMKALRIQPTSEQAVELLEDTAAAATPELMRFVLRFVSRERVGGQECLAAKALEGLIRRECHGYDWEPGTQEEKEQRGLECIELLLDAGARWRPNEDELRYARRGLSRNSGRYLVQVVRLILYTADACDVRTVWELCRTEKMRTLIKSADAPLWEELVTLSKASAAGDAARMGRDVLAPHGNARGTVRVAAAERPEDREIHEQSDTAHQTAPRLDQTGHPALDRDSQR
jgi:hypothetical protein